MWGHFQAMSTLLITPSGKEEGDHLGEPRLHVELLEDGVHVTRGTTIPQPHKPRTGPAVHWGQVLGERRRNRRISVSATSTLLHSGMRCVSGERYTRIYPSRILCVMVAKPMFTSSSADANSYKILWSQCFF